MQNNGWTVINIDNLSLRNIKIGCIINCNGEIPRNLAIKTNILDILTKYDIQLHNIETIDNNTEFSQSLYLIETEYNKLYNILHENV